MSDHARACASVQNGDMLDLYLKQYNFLPDQVQRIREIIYSLSCLASGDSDLIYDANPDYTDKDYEILGKLAKKEIGFQFHPEINYNIT